VEKLEFVMIKATRLTVAAKAIQPKTEGVQVVE